MTEKFPSPFPEEIKIQFIKPEEELEKEKLPESQYALNLITEVNTPVQAIKDGTIFKIKSNSKLYGPDKKLSDKANYIVIDHGDETYSEYSHLGRKIPVRIGQKIKTGEIIGYTGRSGYMKTPHLYLNIFKIEKGNPISIQFEIKKPRTQENLSKIVGMVFILSIGATAILFSKITGNIIGEETANLYGLIPTIIAVISGITWLTLKKK